MSAGDFVPGAEAFTAAYGLGDGGPQCSGSPDFCFFCAFAGSAAGGDETVTELKAQAHALAADKKELPVVAEALHDAYNENIRDIVVWDGPDGKIHKPSWTIEAIKRHLLFSSEFSELFNAAVDQIFHSLIVKLNESCVDAQTGLVVEEHRRALVDTIANFSRWQQHCEKSSGQKRKR